MTEQQNELIELTAMMEGIAETNLVIATKIEELIEMMLAPSEVDVLEKLREILAPIQTDAAEIRKTLEQ